MQANFKQIFRLLVSAGQTYLNLPPPLREGAWLGCLPWGSVNWCGLFLFGAHRRAHVCFGLLGRLLQVGADLDGLGALWNLRNWCCILESWSLVALRSRDEHHGFPSQLACASAGALGLSFFFALHWIHGGSHDWWRWGRQSCYCDFCLGPCLLCGPKKKCIPRDLGKTMPVLWGGSALAKWPVPDIYEVRFVWIHVSSRFELGGQAELQKADKSNAKTKNKGPKTFITIPTNPESEICLMQSFSP